MYRKLLTLPFAALGIAAGGHAQAMAQVVGAGPDSAQVTEVVVTARKRSETLQDVPASVSVVTSQELQALHVNSLEDIGAYVPGLQIDSGGSPGQTIITLRGIPPLSDSATVGTYIDDTPLGGSTLYTRSYTTALDLLPYDLEQLEVLRGPQGTLYGASTLGGLLKYELKRPNLDRYDARIGADLFGVESAGDPGETLRASLSAPIVPGKLAVSASYGLNHIPGYIDNVQTGQKDQNDYLGQSARLALYWKPAQNIDVKLNALYQRLASDDNANVVLSPTTVKPVYGDLTFDNYVSQPYISDLKYYSASVNWGLGWADLTSATSYSQAGNHRVADTSRIYGALFPVLINQPAGLVRQTFDFNVRKFTEELRLTSPSNQRLEWLIGFFYTHENSNNLQYLPAQTFAGVSLGPPYDPLATVQLPADYDERAVFGDVIYHFTSRLDLSAGLRYASNDQDFRNVSSGALVGTNNDPEKSSDSVVTYSVSPKFKINNNVTTYFRAASGYQPGGPNGAIPGLPTPPQIDPSNLTNYEVGLKSHFFGQKVSLDLTAFRLDWTNIQVTVSNGTVAYLGNGGAARSQGVEGSLGLRPFRGLSLDGNFAFTDATILEDTPGINAKAGDRLPLVPRWSGSLQAAYTWPIRDGWDAEVGGGLRLVGKRYSTVQSDPNVLPERSYAALDLRANLKKDRWTVGIFARNLTDERAYLTETYYGIGEAFGSVLQPRTIGVSVDTRF